MKEVTLLVGPQGSGKSTYCQNYLPDYFRVSQDDQGPKLHLEIYKKALTEQPKIVVDRINHTREQRYRYLSLAKEAGYSTKIVVMNRKFKDCLSRIQARQNHPTLKKDDKVAINSALTMYFNQYEYVHSSEADNVERLGNYDPYLIDITHITASKRVILVGDVHGCYNELMQLLSDVKYDPKNDVLIFTGDLVDRGPGIDKTLEFVKNGYDHGLVFTVMSNHEDRYLRYLRGNKVKISHGLQETINQVGLNDDYRYWLEELPLLIKFRPNSYICHAGIIPTVDIERQRKDALLFARTFNPETKSYNDPKAEPFYQFTPKTENLKLYFGHSILPKFHVSSWAKSLDGGAVHGGVLRACVIDPNDVTKIFEVKSSFNYKDDLGEDPIHPNLQPYEERYLQKLVSRSEKGDLVSYKYTDHCTFQKAWDEYTKNARGIIFNKKTGVCVARPFSKFFNINEMPETSIKNLPKEPYDVYDKVDGSLGIMYWDDGEPMIATCGSFHSAQALEATKMLKDTYPEVKNVSRDLTLLFEIIYPTNKIVCDYGDRRELVLLAAFTKDGKEISRYMLEAIAVDVGFPIVDKYDLTIEQMIELQKTIPKDKEGFIVRFKSGLRLKIKGEEYLKLHRVISGITPLNIWSEMKNGKLPDDYKKLIPKELLPDVEKIEQPLMNAYNRVGLEIVQEAEFHFKFLDSYSRPLPKEACKELGLKIQALGKSLKHSSAIFPLYLQKPEALEKYIMQQIRPKFNQL